MINKPLFCICGTYGVGKSAIANNLIARQSNQYIVLNGEITNTPFLPGNGGKMRQLWNDLCFDVAFQTGRSVVYYLNSYVDVHENIPEEKLAQMHFITLICEESVLRKRVSEKWGSFADSKVAGSEMSWAEMAVLRNRYFKTYHDEHPFRNMILIDTTDLTIDEAANQVEAYIKQQINLYQATNTTIA